MKMAIQKTPRVKLDNSGLQDTDGEIVAVGFLDVEAMRALKFDDYQREFLGSTSKGGSRLTHIMRALHQGVRLPGIVIGTRGANYSTERNSIMVLENDTYVIDGRQRVESILQFADAHPDKAKSLSVSVEVRFNTDKDIEQKLFHALNAWRTTVSGNVLLRNMRKDYYGVQVLYDWTHSRRSLLLNRVQWDQRMKRGELLTGIALAQVATTLHNFGRYASGGAEVLARHLENQLNRFAGQELRDNVIYFFDLIDEAFGLSKIEYRERATILRVNFLTGVALLFAGNENFWRGRNLHVTGEMRRKLARFPVGDPEVMRLAAAGQNALPILLDLLTTHMNKAAKKNRLRPRRKRHDDEDEE
jgi:hypothetical protein